MSQVQSPMAGIDIVVCGVGAGATYVYDGETSSTFVLRVNGRPVLLLDCGVGAVRSVISHVGSLPDHVYVSHNHTDHAGDLPVMLAIEAKKGHKMSLLAEINVMSTLATHRLHELQSTGRELTDFAHLQGCPAGQLHQLPCGVALLPLRGRHAERSFGLLVYYNGQPVLGWSGDSAYDAALYSALSAAPVLLLDGRAKGTSEHAGFSQLAAAASSGLFRLSKVFVCGYGRIDQAPAPADYPSLSPVYPGMVLQLSHTTQVAAPAPEMPAQQTGSLPASEAVTRGTEEAAAEATAAAAASAAAAAAAPMSAPDGGDACIGDTDMHEAVASVPAATAVCETDTYRGSLAAPTAGCIQPPQSAAHALAQHFKEQHLQAAFDQQIPVTGHGRQTSLAQVPVTVSNASVQPTGRAACMTGWPGAHMQQHAATTEQQQQNEQSPPPPPQQQQAGHFGELRQDHDIWQQVHLGGNGLPRGALSAYNFAEVGAGAGAVGRQRPGLSTATSTSCNTVA